MTAFYDRLEATAKRLIKDKGYAAHVVRDGAPTGPPHNPTPGTPTEHACYVVETGYSLTNRSDTLIQAGDKVGIISTEIDIVPALSDRLKVDGVLYRFADLAPLRPGGQTMMFEFVARV